MIEVKKEAKKVVLVMGDGYPVMVHVHRQWCESNFNFDFFLPNLIPVYFFLFLLFSKVHWLSVSSFSCALTFPCAAALVYHSFALFKSFVTPIPFS